MATSTAEVEAEGMSAAAEGQAERVGQPLWYRLNGHCSRNSRGWDGFQQVFLSHCSVQYTLELLAIIIRAKPVRM